MFTDKLTERDMRLMENPAVPDAVKIQIMMDRSRDDIPTVRIPAEIGELSAEPELVKVPAAPFTGDCASVYYGYDESRTTSEWNSLKSNFGKNDKEASDYELCVALRYLGIMSHSEFSDADFMTNKRHLNALVGMLNQIISLRGIIDAPVTSMFIEYPGRARDIKRIAEMRANGSIDVRVTDTEFFLNADSLSAKCGVDDKDYASLMKRVMDAYESNRVVPANESEPEPVPAADSEQEPAHQFEEVDLLKELDNLTEDDIREPEPESPTEQQAADMVSQLVKMRDDMDAKRKASSFMGVYEKDPKSWEQVIAYYRMMNNGASDLKDVEIVELILIKDPTITPQRWMEENSDYNVPELPKPKSLPKEADDDFYMWFGETYDSKLAIDGCWTSDIIPAIRELAEPFAEGLDDIRIAAGVLANPHLGMISLQYVKQLQKYKATNDTQYQDAFKSLRSTCLFMQEFRILPIDSKRTIALFAKQNGIATDSPAYVAAMSLANDKTFMNRLNSFPDPDAESAYGGEDGDEPSPIQQEEEAPVVDKTLTADYNVTPWNLLPDFQNWRIIAYDVMLSDAEEEDLSKRYDGNENWTEEQYIEQLKRDYKNNPDNYWKFVFGEDYFTDKHEDRTWKNYYNDEEWLSEDADYATEDSEG